MDLNQICRTRWRIDFVDGPRNLEIEVNRKVADLGVELQAASFLISIGDLLSRVSMGQLRRNRDVKMIKFVGGGELFELRFQCLTKQSQVVKLRLFCVLNVSALRISIIEVYAKFHEASETSRANQNTALELAWLRFKLGSDSEDRKL